MYFGVRTTKNTGVAFGPIGSLIYAFVYFLILILQVTAWIVMGLALVVVGFFTWLYGKWERRRIQKNLTKEIEKEIDRFLKE